MRESTELQHRMLDDKLFKLAADPTQTYLPPERDADVPVLNLAALDNALLRLKKLAKTGDETLSRGGSSAELNALLRGMEQTLVSNEGLPKRDWFRHMIYAPGLQTGYGTKTLPGVREAIEGRRWNEAEHYAGIIAGVLNAYADRIEKITALLTPALK
jgi:N-acetylated-alpha-linked acidic dipeptidase